MPLIADVRGYFLSSFLNRNHSFDSSVIQKNFNVHFCCNIIQIMFKGLIVTKNSHIDNDTVSLEQTAGSTLCQGALNTGEVII